MPLAQAEKQKEPLLFSAIHCVHFNDEIDDENLCRGMTIGPKENEACVRNGCLSFWKACPVCISQGEMEKNDLCSEVCCEKGKNLCRFHSEQGVSAKRKNGDVQSVKKAGVIATAFSGKDTGDTEEITGNVFLVELGSIAPFKEQPRGKFSETYIAQVAESIKTVGQMEPIKLRRLPPGGEFKWELINGENRFRACKLVGLKEIRAIEGKPKDTKEQFLMAVVANFFGQGHTPMEIAHAIQKIKNDFGYSETRIGVAIFGKSPAWVNFHATLLNLHEDIQRRVEPDCPITERISFSLAVSLGMREKNKEKQLVLLKRIKAENLNDKRAKALVRDETEEDIGKRRKAGKVRGRVPSDDYSMFANFLKRTADDLNLHLRSGEKGITRLFEHRQGGDKKMVLRMVEEIIEDFENIASILGD